MCYSVVVNTLKPRQNGRHFADYIFKRIFVNENIWMPIKISLRFVSKGSINNIPALVQVMAWRRPGDKPLSEPMMVSLPTHICVTRPQWVNKDTILYSVDICCMNHFQHYSSRGNCQWQFPIAPLTKMSSKFHFYFNMCLLIDSKM